MIDTNLDWKIRKRLEEAKRVYIYPARGNCKSSWLEDLTYDLCTHTRYTPKLSKSDLDKIREAVIDYDLYSNIVSPMYRDSIDEFIEKQMKDYLKDYRMGWEPKIRIDSTAIDSDRFWKEWNSWNTTYSGFITVNLEDLDER